MFSSGDALRERFAGREGMLHRGDLKRVDELSQVASPRAKTERIVG